MSVRYKSFWSSGEPFIWLTGGYASGFESLPIITVERGSQLDSDNLTAAVRWCEAAGLHRLVLIGSCFGARTILATADRVSGLAGAALASTELPREVLRPLLE